MSIQIVDSAGLNQDQLRLVIAHMCTNLQVRLHDGASHRLILTRIEYGTACVTYDWEDTSHKPVISRHRHAWFKPATNEIFFAESSD